jgi:hypothetical protein
MVDTWGADGSNVAGNKLLDFFLQYANSGVPNWQNRLTDMSFGTGTFDGSALIPTNVPPRVVNGVTLVNGVDRRADFTNTTNTYRGTLTPALVVFLKNKVGITTYSNVNVIGPESEWNGETRTQFTFKNSGIKGTYSNMLQSNFEGIIDIDINKYIGNMNTSLDAKLNLYGNPTNSIGFRGFKVVDTTEVTGNWNNVGNTTDPGSYTPPVVIIYPSRGAAQGFGTAPGPDYRAYVNNGSDKTTYPYKFADLSTAFSTPANWDTTGGRIASLKATAAVPSLDNNDWEQLGNGDIVNIPIRAWGSVTEKFSSMFGDGIALAPSRSGVYLAGGMPAWARTALPSSVLFGRDGKKKKAYA